MNPFKFSFHSTKNQYQYQPLPFSDDAVDDDTKPSPPPYNQDQCFTMSPKRAISLFYTEWILNLHNIARDSQTNPFIKEGSLFILFLFNLFPYFPLPLSAYSTFPIDRKPPPQAYGIFAIVLLTITFIVAGAHKRELVGLIYPDNTIESRVSDRRVRTSLFHLRLFLYRAGGCLFVVVVQHLMGGNDKFSQTPSSATSPNTTLSEVGSNSMNGPTESHNLSIFLPQVAISLVGLFTAPGVVATAERILSWMTRFLENRNGDNNSPLSPSLPMSAINDADVAPSEPPQSATANASSGSPDREVDTRDTGAGRSSAVAENGNAPSTSRNGRR